MQQRGMTQEALACELGRGQSWVNHKLSGRRKANVEDIVLIARALGIEPSALLKNVTNYEKLTDSFIGVAEPHNTYQASWLSELTEGLKQLDDREAKLFIDEVLTTLETRIRKQKGG